MSYGNGRLQSFDSLFKVFYGKKATEFQGTTFHQSIVFPLLK